MSDSDDLEAIRERKRQRLLDEGGSGGGQRAPAQPDQPVGSPAEPVYVDSKAELEQLATAHHIVLADFYADWCGPCKMLEPTVRELAQKTEAAVAKVDVDALPGLAQEMGIRGVPSLFLYVDGELVKRLVGVQDYGTLESLVSEYAS